MQSVVPILPKLDGIGRDSKASPERRSLDGNIFETLCRLSDCAFKRLRVIELGALLRRPGPELTSTVAACEIRVGLFVGCSSHRPAHTYLHAGRVPMKRQRGMGVLFEIARLLAFEVGVEHEAARVEAPEQDEPSRGMSLCIRRRERASTRLERLAFSGTRILTREALDRIILFHGRGPSSRCFCAISAQDPAGSRAR